VKTQEDMSTQNQVGPARKVTGQINIDRGRLGSFVHSLSLRKPEAVRKFGGGAAAAAIVQFYLV
jgi:hypothetical protein